MSSQDSQQTQLEPIPANLPQQAISKNQRRSVKPTMVKTAVLAKTIAGDNMSKIAKDLDIDRSTVRTILSASDIQQSVEAIRSEMVLDGDLLLTRRNLRRKLESGSESVTLAVARGYGILKSNPETTINVLNVGAASYAQRMETRSVDAITVESAENTTSNSVPPPGKE